MHVAPTVAVQMDYWYEEECEELARSIAHPIHVRVDPMIHPEKARIEVVGRMRGRRRDTSFASATSTTSSCWRDALPNATSAAAVVDGRLAEVENAANNAGNFVRIRIIDVEDKDDYVLAELVTAGAKSRRKRRRAPRRSLTQPSRRVSCASLRKTQRASRHRVRPIGITSITEEEEAQDKALRAERIGEAQPDAIIIAEGVRAHVAGDGRRKRRRRRRGRGREDAAA